ncbi:MAG: class I SAM-dependent methyltransferase [Chloroflexi bacterium]|nr:class I SAM-dependent methyltransferase [Chloroflexota bacterium]
MPPANDYPTLYHAHHNRQLEDLPFWLHLAKQLGSPILELGCGTGRIFTPIHRAGYRITGIDHDPVMLAYLLQNWVAHEPPDLIQAEMTDFALAPVFRLVILPCNTYSTLQAAQRQQTLKCVRRCLLAGGVFAISMPNPNILKRLPTESTSEIEDIFAHPNDGEPVQVSSAWQRELLTFSLTWHYDHLLPDGHVERTTAHSRQFMEDLNNYMQEFHQAGFSDVKVFGNFDKTPYDDDSPGLIFTAR